MVAEVGEVLAAAKVAEAADKACRRILQSHHPGVGSRGKLEDPASEVKKLSKQLDKCLQDVDMALRLDAFVGSIKDLSEDALVRCIRTLCGRDEKLQKHGMLVYLSKVSKKLRELRASQSLVKACKAFAALASQGITTAEAMLTATSTLDMGFASYDHEFSSDLSRLSLLRSKLQDLAGIGTHH